MGAVRAILLSAFGLALAVPTAAVAPDLAMFGKLQDGLWELHFRDGSPPRRLCWHASWRLIQLQHQDAACERIVIEDTPNATSVQYTCRGKGFGRTAIRRETAQLIQIETQGLAGGLPFVMAGEGRRLGDCPVSQAPQVVASPAPAH